MKTGILTGLLGGAGGGGGYVFVTNVVPTGSGNVASKVYADTEPSNKVLLSCTSDTMQVTVYFEAEGGEIFSPTVSIGGVACTNLSQISTTRRYTGSIPVTLTGSGSLTIQSDTGQKSAVEIITENPPVISEVVFTSPMPGTQTELKENDTQTIQVTADKPFTTIEIADYEAAKSATRYVSENTVNSCQISIADRGESAVERPVKVRVKTAEGSTSDWFTSIETVNCNNLHPSFTFNSITYPDNQEALKDDESADISVSAINFDSIEYQSQNNELSIPDTTTYGESKTVTRASGTYNDAVTNYTITATRAANDASSIYNDIIKIADTLPLISISKPASRLRSGGNDGTSAQNYTISLSANQDLIEAPTLDIPTNAGEWLGGFAGSGQSWTRTLQVHDNHNKGDFTFTLSAKNLAGKIQTVISSGGTYELGGFVERTVTLGGYANEVQINVAVIDYLKVEMIWSNLALPTQADVGTTATTANAWCLDALEINPTTVRVLDPRTSSSPTTITIEEII